MTLLDRVPYVRQLWTMLLPHVPQPADEFLVKWAFDYSEPEIEYAVVRTSKKFRHQALEPIIAHRYCSGILKNEREKRSQGFNKWERQAASKAVEAK